MFADASITHAVVHARTFAPSHLRTLAPSHLRTLAPSHLRTLPPSPHAPCAPGTPAPSHHAVAYTRRVFFRGQVIGKYRIVSTIGSGGFGTVYLAEDTWIDKKVALKVPHRQEANFDELLREPRLLASLNHPNIVAILT